MIQLLLSSAPLDEVPGKVALATFFEDVRPLKGTTGLIDWRLNGRLSELILQGKISGSFAESLIMPAQGRLAAEEIFLFGLGRAQELNERQLEQGFVQLIAKLSLLKSPAFVISFGDLAKDFMGWRSILRNFMTALSHQVGEEDLQVFCAEDPRWIHEAKRRNMDFGANVALDY